jgi:hypothetical protein
MLRKFFLLGYIGFFLIVARTNITAEEATVTQPQEEWNPVSAGPITTWTAPLCGKGTFVIQPFFFYNHARGTFNSEGHYKTLPNGEDKHQYQEQLFMQYGITDRLEIDAQAVYQENYAKRNDSKAHENGFGDSYLFLRYCALEERGWFPHVAGVLQVKAPTGKYQHLDLNKLETDSMGTGSWDPGFGLILTKKLKPFIFHADAVYSFPQQTRIDAVKTHYANYLSYDFGVEYFLPKGFNLLLETNGFLQGDTKENGTRTFNSDTKYLIISPGIGWSCDKLQTLLAYQRTIIGTNTDANDSVVLTCVYAF